MVVINPHATYTIPYGVFFAELDDEHDRFAGLNTSLVRELYAPERQCDAVFAIMRKAGELITTGAPQAADMRTALTQLFTAVMPFMEEWEGRMVPDAYRNAHMPDWYNQLEKVDPYMEEWFSRWRHSMQLDEFDNFSYHLATNLAKLIFYVNSNTLIYTGCARGLDANGSWWMDIKYPMVDLLEDFLHPYKWLLELVGDR